MSIIAILVFVVLGIGLGVTAKLVSPVQRKKDPKEGASAPAILGATGMLATFTIALVLASTAGSYNAAARASKSEADTIDNLYKSADYVDPPARQAIQASAVCYARAVIGPESKTLRNGELSPVTNNWTDTGPFGLRKTFIGMGTAAKGFGLVQSADAKRAELRSERLAQSRPSVPTLLFGFMMLLIAMSLGALAFSLPRAENGAEIVALAIVAVLFTCAVLLIHNLDHPYDGPLAQKPSALQSVERTDAAVYAATYGTPLPCNEQGEPLPQ